MSKLILAYHVSYRNQGYLEHTAPMSHEEAEKSKEFLKFQGAKNTRIIKTKYPWAIPERQVST